MNSKNVIELNGKRYDAATGTLLGASIVPHQLQAPNNSKKSSHKTVDGAFRSGKLAVAIPAKHKITVASTTTVAAPPAPRPRPKPAHSAANNAVPHQPQTTHTLMRSAVTKPGLSLKKQIQVQSTLQRAVPALIAKKTSVQTIEPHRLARSQSIARSQHISRFDNTSAHIIPVTVSHVPVQVPPIAAGTPTVPAPHTTNKPLDMFEQAIVNATHFVDTSAHKAHFRAKARRHAASMTAGGLALLVIVGFAAYQNTPGLQLKVAGFKAGVATTGMPNFKAAGFAYNGVTSKFGKLTVGLTSGNSTYQLTQQNTNWSSDDMIQNIAAIGANGEPNYATVQAGTTPAYRFNNTSATWVKNGSWYQVTGSALSDSQVKALVSNT